MPRDEAGSEARDLGLRVQREAAASRGAGANPGAPRPCAFQLPNSGPVLQREGREVKLDRADGGLGHGFRGLRLCS